MRLTKKLGLHPFVKVIRKYKDTFRVYITLKLICFVFVFFEDTDLLLTIHVLEDSML